MTNKKKIILPRYKVLIEYDGTEFYGWQSQKNMSAIQDEVEGALLKLSQEKIRIYGASRTDKGVHAHGQVAHFDINRDYTTFEMQGAVNYYLKPQKVSIIAVEKVNDDFHARFSAKTKQYTYKIINRIAEPTLLKNRAWHIKEELDINAMTNALNYLIGIHDFSSFRAAGCQSLSPVKTIDSIRLNKIDNEINITFIAKSFLYNQIRIMVGTLSDFGKGKFPPSYMKKIIKARDRRLAGITAPSCGLYLDKISYHS